MSANGAAQVIEALIKPAKDLDVATKRGGDMELTDDEIALMLAAMKPIVHRDGKKYFIEPVDVANAKRKDFVFGATLAEEATVPTEIAKIFTLHTYEYYGFFKPSLEEVLTMIPPNMLDTAKAFETVGPEDASDLNRQPAAMDEGYHVAVTILYG